MADSPAPPAQGCWYLTGPTAAGKTKVGVELAQWSSSSPHRPYAFVTVGGVHQSGDFEAVVNSLSLKADLPSSNHLGVSVGSVVVASLGILLAWLMYRPGTPALDPKKFTAGRAGAFLHRLLSNKYYMDELYAMTVVAFAKAVAVANHQPGFFTVVLEILRPRTDRGKLINPVVPADFGPGLDDDMGTDLGPRTDFDVFADNAVRPDAGRRIDFRRGVDNGRGMNHGFTSAAEEAAKVALSSASATSLPSTKACPAKV